MNPDSIFLVTGASSGIGKAICLSLLRRSVEVIGVSRTSVEFTPSESADIDPSQFQWLCCDLADFGALSTILGGELKALATRKPVSLGGVVLCHGYGDFGAVEQFSNKRIARLIDTNLTSHIMISRLVLPMLKTAGQGDLIFIGSESSLKGGKKGAVYCATKFGLRGFAQSLRQECSTANVRVSIVNPGMVETAFFDELDFEPGESRENRLHAQTVADTVMGVFDMPKGSVIDEINLSPLKTVIRNR